MQYHCDKYSSSYVVFYGVVISGSFAYSSVALCCCDKKYHIGILSHRPNGVGSFACSSLAQCKTILS